MIYFRSKPIGRPPPPQLRSPQINGLFFFASVFALLLLLYEVISDIALLLFAPGPFDDVRRRANRIFLWMRPLHVCVLCAWGSLLTWRLYITPPVKKKKKKPPPWCHGWHVTTLNLCVCVVYLFYTFFFFSHTLLIYFLPLAITRMSDAGALLSKKKIHTHLYLYFSLDGVCVARWERNYEMNMR